MSTTYYKYTKHLYSNSVPWLVKQNVCLYFTMLMSKRLLSPLVCWIVICIIRPGVKVMVRSVVNECHTYLTCFKIIKYVKYSKYLRLWLFRRNNLTMELICYIMIRNIIYFNTRITYINTVLLSPKKIFMYKPDLDLANK